MEELTKQYVPVQGLVLYKEENSNNKYLEIVDIEDGKMKNPLPASLKLVGRMIEGVQYEDQKKTIVYEGIIPKEIILCECTPDRLKVIFQDNSPKRTMFFANEMFPQLEYNVPKLIFKVTNKDVRVYAYFKDCGRETKLFRAPFLNVGNNGSTCMGSAALDDWKDFKNVNEFIRHVKDKFWNSEFSELHGSPTKFSYKEYLEYCITKTPKSHQLTNTKKRLKDIL